MLFPSEMDGRRESVRSNNTMTHTLQVTDEEVAAITAKLERQKMANRNMNLLLELANKPGNHICADCCYSQPEWASYNIGIFICTQCAVFHRNLGTHISKVKSLKLDIWDDDQLQKMNNVGNQKAKDIYEKSVPLCYLKPTYKDCQVLREQWVRAKYEREEFINTDRQVYTAGHMEVNLWKRGKEDGRFQIRKFVLNEVEDTIKYYIKDTHKEPKATIRISDVNATFVPIKIGNPNGLQLSFVKDGSTRHIFLYSDDGKDIVHWYMAIRSAKLNRLHVAFPGANELELATRLTRDFPKEGWLYKTGPKEGDHYRKRWFTLDDRKLMYMEMPLDAYPKGEIFLGHRSDGHILLRGIPPGGSRVHAEDDSKGYFFTLCTPKRTYYFKSESDEDRGEWIRIIDDVLERSLTPQDSSSK